MTAALATLVDADHPLLQMAARIAWPPDEAAGPGSRLMLGLHLLTILRGLSDREVCQHWEENPYFQIFCGETRFRHRLDLDPEALARWRASVGTARLAAWVSPILPRAREKPCTFVIDVDGVVAKLTPGNDYRLAEPIAETIAAINRLYDDGHTIIMLTARGSKTGISWREVTEGQFARWGLKFHELHFGKPAADYYVDDRMVGIATLRAMASGLDFPPSSLAPRVESADAG